MRTRADIHEKLREGLGMAAFMIVGLIVLMGPLLIVDHYVDGTGEVVAFVVMGAFGAFLVVAGVFELYWLVRDYWTDGGRR